MKLCPAGPYTSTFAAKRAATNTHSFSYDAANHTLSEPQTKKNSLIKFIACD